MDTEKNCDKDDEYNFPSDSTSTGAGGDFFSKGRLSKAAPPSEEQKLSSSFSPLPSSTTSSSLSHVPQTPFDSPCRPCSRDYRTIPDPCYEMDVAKSILQQYSTLSGNNLYDHLSDIIKRVIDERPPNVIDFFEEFSRNIREQKFNAPERFPPTAVFEETRMFKIAKLQLRSMRLPYDKIENESPEENLGLEESKSSEQSLHMLETPRRLFNVFSDHIHQLQFYWNQCGFSISHEDVNLLAISIDRLQTHPSIQGCRFWGVVNGLRASYYIVEASLTKEHRLQRLEQMEVELREKFETQLQRERRDPDLPTYIGPELTPGFYGWENYPKEELKDMKPKAAPIPLPRLEEIYDIPPEMIGTGLNRFSYFVVNALTDDWLELPIVTPKQIVISRQMKKFFTGDMESEICSYPCFPGKEKHYLRAMIARITCGTTIAPRGYYRKMTKYERCVYEGDDEEECVEEDDASDDIMLEGEEGDEIDNDILPVRNEKYKLASLDDLSAPSKWVHIRPYILKQGRIIWFDELRARRERAQELRRLRKLEVAEEEEEEDDSDDDDESLDDEEDDVDRQEYGSHIFSVCNNDICNELTVPWVSRFTSHFTNKVERVLVMRSNIWPGSTTFTFDNVCETIYMGWGLKYVSRNMLFHHLPEIADEYPHEEDDFVETTDPPVSEEQAYREFLQNRMKQALEYAAFEIIEEDDEDDST